MNGQQYGADWRPQGKGVAISAVIHAILITLAVLLSVNYVKKAPELMTISLDNEKIPPPRPERVGGDGRKAGSEGTDKKAAKGAPGTMIKRTAQRADEKRESLRPYPDAAPRTTSTTPADTVPEQSPSSDYTLLKGNGEGLGGGGGKGIGSYGSGSGFGGTGKEGMGGGAGKGTGGSRKADVERYLRENYDYIRDRILGRLAYPLMAKKMGWEGKVSVRFEISEKGLAGDLKVVESSGHRLLDDNVMDTIKQVQPFPKPPAPATLTIPITYSLKNT